MEQEKNIEFSIPFAILLAGVIIAGAIVFTNWQNTNQLTTVESPKKEIAENIAPVNAKDHILGNFNTAEVFIVEFSDLECPFCKMFHETLKQIIEEYGDSGRVAWVYRHFPLEGLHPKAFKESEATECATELGGELKFWEYTDRLFQITPSNNGLDLSLLPQIAKDVGLDATAFETCIESGRHATKVRADLEDAIKSGGRGTPHTIIMRRDGTGARVIQGAESMTVVRSNIEQLLNP